MIVPPKSRSKAQRLLKMAKLTAEWADAPSAEEVTERDQIRLLSDATWSEPVADQELEFIKKLTELYTAEQIAAAYMRLYSDRKSAPEELDAAPAENARKPRVEFGKSVWFTVSQGRDQGAEPRRLLPMVCNAGNITKDDIGAIRVQAKESYVEIRQAIAKEFQDAVGPEGKLEDNIRLRKLDKAPDLDKIQRPPRLDYGGNRAPSGGPSGARKHLGEKSKSSHRAREAKPDFSENRKSNYVQTERCLPDPRPERSRPDGVVTQIKGSKTDESKSSQGYKKKAEGKGKPKPASGKTAKPGGYKDKPPGSTKVKKAPWSKGKEAGFSKSKKPSSGQVKDGVSKTKETSSNISPSDANRYRAPANDTSKRFVPPGGSKTAKRRKASTQGKDNNAEARTGKPFGKPKVTKGPNAVPRRPKQK